MIYSMTGFGRAEYQADTAKINVEIRSVNHRYLDVSIRTPRRLASYEGALRNAVKEAVSRGKVDVTVTVEELRESAASLHYNESLARQYIAFAECMIEEFDVEDDLTVSRLMRCPEVLTMREDDPDEEELRSGLLAAVRAALDDHAGSRSNEGAALAADLLQKLDDLRVLVDRVLARAPQILEEYKERLREKTKELLENSQIDDGRIAAEVVLFADRICTDEETVRLVSHIENMRALLLSGGDIGRKLDFIAQEMNREANTILSKANDTEITEIGIELKTGIEKIREQIQNIA